MIVINYGSVRCICVVLFDCEGYCWDFGFINYLICGDYFFVVVLKDVIIVSDEIFVDYEFVSGINVMVVFYIFVFEEEWS